MKLEFSLQIFEKMEAELFHEDGQTSRQETRDRKTGRHDEAKNLFFFVSQSSKRAQI